MAHPFRLTCPEPSETDLYAEILPSLGAEQRAYRDTARGPRLCSLGVYLAPKAIFWRQNSGGVRLQSGHYCQIAPYGIPDLVGCVDGQWIGLEVKRPGEPANDNQERFREWITAAGGIYGIVHSAREARAFLDASRRPPL